MTDPNASEVNTQQEQEPQERVVLHQRDDETAASDPKQARQGRVTERGAA